MDNLIEIAIPALCGIGAILGLLMIFSPVEVSRTGQQMGEWYRHTALMRLLDTPRSVERIFYRHHRLYGILIIVGSLWSLISLLRMAGQRQKLMGLVDFMHSAVAEIAIDTTFVVLVLGSSFAFAVGLVVLLRPSLLKRIELTANRWVDHLGDRASGSPDTQSTSLAPRVLGGLILLFSLFVLVQWLLFRLS